MARTVRDASLATRSARLRLAVAHKPYWRVIEQGLHLGYRRRATGGTWIARRRNDDGAYRECKLGLADDLQDAFSQSQRAARILKTNYTIQCKDSSVVSQLQTSLRSRALAR